MDNDGLITTVQNTEETTTSTETSFGADKKKRRSKKKINLNLKCPFCESGTKYVSYKDVFQLKKYISVRGKIMPTDKTGVCHKHQKQLKRKQQILDGNKTKPINLTKSPRRARRVQFLKNDTNTDPNRLIPLPCRFLNILFLAPIFP